MGLNCQRTCFPWIQSVIKPGAASAGTASCATISPVSNRILFFMSQTWRWLGLRGICVGLMLALSGCAWLGEQQRQIIYRPTLSASQGTTHLPPGLLHYRLALPHPGPSGHLAFWWLPQPDADAPTLLYLHGTFRNLEGNLHKINALHQAGFQVLAVDYRGWGQSS